MCYPSRLLKVVSTPIERSEVKITLFRRVLNPGTGKYRKLGKIGNLEISGITGFIFSSHIPRLYVIVSLIIIV